MKRPLIAVTPLYDQNMDSLWMLPAYLKGLSEARAIPMLLPLELNDGDMEAIASRVDGYLFTGGPDVDPALYGQEPHPSCEYVCALRDRLEREVYGAAMAQGKPILGICRGLQVINALRGGTLYQDLPAEHPAAPTMHRMERPYDRAAHGAALKDGSPLHRAYGKARLEVNSCHHQAVKDIGRGLEAMAWAEDGVIEALYAPDHPFLWGVQWHPEFRQAKDPDSQRIFDLFAEACRAQMK